MSRTNNVTFENVFAQNASTAIPSQPITGVSYRDDTQTAEQIETGQAYDSIYNSARYNQLFYQMTSLLADMAKNGLLPFQSGQHYLAGARVLDGGLIYIANREILASEQPYPSPNIDSQAWTPAVSTSSDLGGDGASDQAVPSQKAVKTYVDDNFLPLSGGVINGNLATNGQYFAIKADFAKGTVPDTNKYYQLSVADNSGDYNAGHRFGCFATIIKNDGSVQTNIYALKNAANQATGTAMGITVKSDGTQSWYCPSICEQKERRADVNNSIVRIYGGATDPTSNKWNQSAIELCGWENTTYPGWVVIRSGNGTTQGSLVLKQDDEYVNSYRLLCNIKRLTLNNSEGIICTGSTNNDQRILLCGGSGWAKGSCLELAGQSNEYDGKFRLIAVNSGDFRTELIGTGGTANHNGSLTWGNKEIERIDSAGSKWIRYVNGIQICWGYVDCNPTTQASSRYYHRSTITYPVAFKSTPECILTPYDSTTSNSQNPWCSCMIEHPSATSCGAFVWSMTTSPSGTTIKVSYIAIGYWK